MAKTGRTQNVSAKKSTSLPANDVVASQNFLISNSLPSLVNRECLYEKRRSFCKVIIFLKMIQLLTLFTPQILHLRHFFQCFCGEYVVLPGAFTSRSFLIKKGEVGKQCI